MIILYFLIGCSIVMALIFLAAFFWSLKDGQQDDMVTPAIRILFDDEVSQKTASLEVGKTGLPDYKLADALSDKDHFSE